MQTLIRLVAFVVMFGVGTSAIGLSALCDDLLHYYRNQQALVIMEQQIDSLRSLNGIHDALLLRIDSDPEIIQKIAPAVLGMKREDPNTVYPIAGVEELDAAEQTLIEHNKAQKAVPTLPDWLVRTSEYRRRIGLFLAGAILVLVSFACFGLIKREPEGG